MKNIYSGFFLKESDKHITWDFNPGKCELPEGFKEGQTAAVVSKGMYSDNDCKVEIVEVSRLYGEGEPHKRQPKSHVLLHITHECDGITPAEAGIRATVRSGKFTYDKYTYIEVQRIQFATVGFFSVEDEPKPDTITREEFTTAINFLGNKIESLEEHANGHTQMLHRLINP